MERRKRIVFKSRYKKCLWKPVLFFSYYLRAPPPPSLKNTLCKSANRLNYSLNWCYIIANLWWPPPTDWQTRNYVMFNSGTWPLPVTWRVALLVSAFVYMLICNALAHLLAGLSTTKTVFPSLLNEPHQNGGLCCDSCPLLVVRFKVNIQFILKHNDDIIITY